MAKVKLCKSNRYMIILYNTYYQSQFSLSQFLFTAWLKYLKGRESLPLLLIMWRSLTFGFSCDTPTWERMLLNCMLSILMSERKDFGNVFIVLIQPN